MSVQLSNNDLQKNSSETSNEFSSKHPFSKKPHFYTVKSFGSAVDIISRAIALLVPAFISSARTYNTRARVSRSTLDNIQSSWVSDFNIIFFFYIGLQMLWILAPLSFFQLRMFFLHFIELKFLRPMCLQCFRTSVGYNNSRPLICLVQIFHQFETISIHFYSVLLRSQNACGDFFKVYNLARAKKFTQLSQPLLS